MSFTNRWRSPNGLHASFESLTHARNDPDANKLLLINNNPSVSAAGCANFWTTSEPLQGPPIIQCSGRIAGLQSSESANKYFEKQLRYLSSTSHFGFSLFGPGIMVCDLLVMPDDRTPLCQCRCSRIGIIGRLHEIGTGSSQILPKDSRENLADNSSKWN